LSRLSRYRVRATPQFFRYAPPSFGMLGYECYSIAPDFIPWENRNKCFLSENKKAPHKAGQSVIDSFLR
jgi:hypothetical protein